MEKLSAVARAAQVRELDKAVVRMEKEIVRMDSPKRRSTPRKDLSHNGGVQNRGVRNGPRVGDQVVLHSLQRSELNGCRGEVVRDNCTQADGRFAIRIGKVQFNVKPENLTIPRSGRCERGISFADDCLKSAYPKPGATLGKFMHSQKVVAVGDSIRTLGSKFAVQNVIVGTWAYEVSTPLLSVSNTSLLEHGTKSQVASSWPVQLQQYTIDEDLVFRETLRDKSKLEGQLKPAEEDGKNWMIADLSPQGTIRLRYDGSEVPGVVRAQYDWTGEGFGRVVTAISWPAGGF